MRVIIRTNVSLFERRRFTMSDLDMSLEELHIEKNVDFKNAHIPEIINYILEHIKKSA